MSKTKDTTIITSIDDPQDLAIEQSEDAPALVVSDALGVFNGERAELTINSSEGEVGQQAVFLGINGHGFNIPRDKKVNVPKEVIDQLDNCMMTIYESIVGGGTREREVKRFSYSSRILAPTK